MFFWPDSGGPVRRGLVYPWGHKLSAPASIGQPGHKKRRAFVCETPVLRCFLVFQRSTHATRKQKTAQNTSERFAIQIPEARSVVRPHTQAHGRAFREQKRAGSGALCFGANRKSQKKGKPARSAGFSFFSGAFLRQKPRPCDHPATA